jgi:cytidine deaminase
MTDLFSITEAEKTQLIETAQRALSYAYAPYSQFRVGAAVLTEKRQIFAGCNVENASYGLSICAERNAIATAIMAEGGGTIKIKAIAVVNNQDAPCSPCGACRQVIWEFGKDALVIFRGSQGWQTFEMRKLLPQGFSF